MALDNDDDDCLTLDGRPEFRATGDTFDQEEMEMKTGIIAVDWEKNAVNLNFEVRWPLLPSNAIAG